MANRVVRNPTSLTRLVYVDGQRAVICRGLEPCGPLSFLRALPGTSRYYKAPVAVWAWHSLDLGG